MVYDIFYAGAYMGEGEGDGHTYGGEEGSERGPEVPEAEFYAAYGYVLFYGVEVEYE